ncbi:MAG: superoxide dismutase, Fe-Mn family [Parcubacteria group bacterium Gr01-1014_17]|nr:MAG: superoxide dismutase, Fe-Mn family [Parcubacteria group bacterium Gr01-1014_17]
MQFIEQKFNIPPLKGISAKNIEEHLKLYAGYVKHANFILEEIKKGAVGEYALAEMQRRFSFEFNGMVNHEYYFESFMGGAKPLAEASGLRAAIAKEWESFDVWLARFKAIALTRGVGWAILYFDPLTKRPLNAWVDEQHLGQLNGCKTILALDMWEHSFVADYQPSGKKNYIEDFFANLNWKVVERNFSNATSK